MAKLQDDFASADTVTIDRVEYDMLLSLTTPQLIETAPRDKYILVCGNFGWVESLFNPHFNEFMTRDEFGVERATHWMPLPTEIKK